MSEKQDDSALSGLRFRWSTPEDRPGIALCAALTWGKPEGFEDPVNVRLAERLCFPEFIDLTDTRWIVCVSTSGPRDYTSIAHAARGSPDSDPYLSTLRAEASASPEPIIAAIHYWPMAWKIEGERVKVAKTALVACRPECRAGALRAGRGQGVMERLWKMYFEKMKEDKAAFSTICGIPNYYGRYGFEHAIHYGCGFSTSAASLADLRPDASYRVRRVFVSDVPTLLEAWSSNHTREGLWVDIAPAQLEQHLLWVTGKRHEPFTSQHDRVGPDWVLEREGRFVAAAFTSRFPEVATPNASQLTIGAVLYARDADLPIAAEALVAGLVGAAGMTAIEEELAWQADVAKEPIKREDGGEARTGSVASIVWALSDHHPFALAMVEAKVAQKHPDMTSYSPYTDWLVGIPSLTTFCEALKPALTQRVARHKATCINGTPPLTGTIRLSTYRSSSDAVQIEVLASGAVEITSLSYSPAELLMAPHAPGMANLPHLIGPVGPLTQLLMGYASWGELRKVHRDLCAARESLPLLEVLFPTVHTSVMHTFG